MATNSPLLRKPKSAKNDFIDASKSIIIIIIMIDLLMILGGRSRRFL